MRERIGLHMGKLEQLSRRYGVPPRSNVLSSEHLQIVQKALHGHLEILPTEVLQKMIACENSANSIIEKEWVPREKTRQLALEQLKSQNQAKARLNQDLVRQAMVALGSISISEASKTDHSHQEPSVSPPLQPAQVMEHATASPAPVEPTLPHQAEGFVAPFSVKDLAVITVDSSSSSAGHTVSGQCAIRDDASDMDNTHEIVCAAGMIHCQATRSSLKSHKSELLQSLQAPGATRRERICLSMICRP